MNELKEGVPCVEISKRKVKPQETSWLAAYVPKSETEGMGRLLFFKQYQQVRCISIARSALSLYVAIFSVTLTFEALRKSGRQFPISLTKSSPLHSRTASMLFKKVVLLSICVM
jgi:hypothetical protein